MSGWGWDPRPSSTPKRCQSHCTIRELLFFPSSFAIRSRSVTCCITRNPLTGSCFHENLAVLWRLTGMEWAIQTGEHSVVPLRSVSQAGSDLAQLSGFAFSLNTDHSLDFVGYFFFDCCTCGIQKFPGQDCIQASAAACATTVVMPDPLAHCTRPGIESTAT